VSRSSNSASQRDKRMPVNKQSADTNTGAGGTHEEWETASESSDILKDTDVPSQSSKGDKHASSRRESKKGYSNQRHTQSRRGRYRDRPSSDVSSANAAETGSGSSAQPTCTDSAVFAAANSTNNGGRHDTFPHSDPNGPNGNVNAVYRLDQVVFNDPFAIQTAFSNIFIRYLCIFMSSCTLYCEM